MPRPLTKQQRGFRQFVIVLRTVARETSRILAIAEMLSPALRSFLAVSFCSSVRAWGLPICAPLALAACSPALVRSDMSARSYSAKDAAIWKNILPRAVEVSMPSLRDWKCTPLACRSSRVATRSLRDLPSLSMLATTRVSPRPRPRLQAFHSGRSMFAPVACSW